MIIGSVRIDVIRKGSFCFFNGRDKILDEYKFIDIEYYKEFQKLGVVFSEAKVSAKYGIQPNNILSGRFIKSKN